jgi:hypothetical protein
VSHDGASSSCSRTASNEVPAATAAAAGPDGAGRCSYVASLLHNSTAEHLQCVLTWSCSDWQNYWRVRPKHE